MTKFDSLIILRYINYTEDISHTASANMPYKYENEKDEKWLPPTTVHDIEKKGGSSQEGEKIGIDGPKTKML